MSLDLLATLRALFSDARRLYRLEGGAGLDGLWVESWQQHEALDAPWLMHLDALSTDAQLDVHAMLGERATLFTRLADGGEHRRSGLVTAAAALDADGGLARYRLTIEPWLGLLTRSTACRVWQEQSVTAIVESVLVRYPGSRWQWAPCVAPHLQASAQGGERSYTVQYRETDLAFLHRLLAREALAYRLDCTDEGDTVVFFADSVNKTSCPEDASSAHLLGGRGIRYHRANSQEEQDAIQAFGGQRQLTAARVTTLTWDYKARRAVAASVPTAAAFGGKHAPALEHYAAHAHQGSYAAADGVQAERIATHLQQALEARHKTWLGRSTVRTFSPGRHFTLTQSDMSVLDALQDLSSGSSTPGATQDRHRFLITRASHFGINNLPKDTGAQIAQRLGTPEPIEQAEGTAPWPAEVLRQAAQSGYANHFEAIRAAVPWRPAATAAPARLPSPGVLTATVVGPQGQTSASGAEQIHMDALGRVRIAFDFQQIDQPDTARSGAPTSRASTWVRVLQRWAGAGMGQQFMPRIGQQVLVDFVGGDIERPLIVGSLYDGQGEGGIPATPGGQDATPDPSVFQHSTDHSPGAQANITQGHAPAWHGQSAGAVAAGGQNNAAALSGYKSAEFGNEGRGFNQLVFDDSNQQLRAQLATTQHATQLNLGHLVHQADNHRGSFRGLGFELRTDAYGAIRAGRGVLISSFGTQPAEPAGDNAAGMALQGQLASLATTFSRAAGTHQTVKLASAIGSTAANQNALDPTKASATALHTVLKGMVAASAFDTAQADAAAKTTAATEGQLPHSTGAVVEVAAKAGLGLVAGQDLQWSAAEGITLASGHDTHFASGGASRIHTGQAIGMLAGTVKPGDQAAGKGLTLVAGEGEIDVQAQAGTLQVAAKRDVSIQSQSTSVDWAAAKRIVLATSGGASVTLEGGNIVVECPGKITIRAGKKSFVGPQTASYGRPKLPKVPFEPIPVKFNLGLQDLPGKLGAPRAYTSWQILCSRDGEDFQPPLFSGQTDAEGKIKLSAAQEKELAERYAQAPGTIWVKLPGQLRKLDIAFERDHWTAADKAREALAAMDYSSVASVASEDPGDASKAVAGNDTGRSAFPLWNDLKNR